MNFVAFISVAIVSLFSSYTLQAKTTISQKKISDKVYEISISFDAQEGKGIYQDSLEVSINSPQIKLGPWNSSIEPTLKYDPTFKTSKQIFTQPFSITLQTQAEPDFPDSATLFITYYRQAAQRINQDMFELNFPQKATPSTTPQESITTSLEEDPIPKSAQPQTVSWAACVQNKLQSTDSILVRILLSLFLGLLLSLTPCIYPMIPITMGILQSQGSTSLGRNFILALTYTLGIATTFALLGVTAAFTGNMFGNIMNNPYVIFVIVALLIYLAGSMIGFYDMYIPPLLRPKNNQLQGSSLPSIFLFGAASGTMASPCLSPGLLLLLTIVTTLGSYFLGFILLFSFGFGLGFPLLIIGTFSSSLTVLPRAGMWMVEIKQFFGFIMLGACLYFLQCALPPYIIAWLMAALVFSIGVFYLYKGKAGSKPSRFIKTIMGSMLVAVSIYLMFDAFKNGMSSQNCAIKEELWMTDYAAALERAQQCQQKMLIDISAPYCSICKAIDKKIFAHQDVIAALYKYVTIKIADIESNEITRSVKDKFHVMGAPTIVLYDPITDKEIQRWGAELYDLTPHEFIGILKKLD